MTEISEIFNSHDNMFKYFKIAYDEAVKNMFITTSSKIEFIDTYFHLLDTLYYATNEIIYGSNIVYQVNIRESMLYNKKASDKILFRKQVKCVHPSVLLMNILDFITEELINRERLK